MPLSKAEAILKQMSTEEKVGQLFWIRPDQLLLKKNNDDIHDPETEGVREVTEEMKEAYAFYPAGSFVIFGKNIHDPEQLKALKQDLHSLNAISPVLAVDEEGGLVARIGNAPGFDVEKIPDMEEIGKSGDAQKAYEAGYAIGTYLCTYDFDLNFAPVADINTNPNNIVIGKRAFGSDPELVKDMVSSYIDGLHEAGCRSCIKHFPGHGDTNSDTHTGYAEVTKSWTELCEKELVPFAGNMEKTDTIMAAHITLTSLEAEDLPSSLSRTVITNKLRTEMGYDGVVISDALAMGGDCQALYLG